MSQKITIIRVIDKERIDTVIKIQVQDGIFSWMTVEQLQDEDIDNVTFYTEDVKRQYPDKRIRAVSSGGSILDMR